MVQSSDHLSIHMDGLSSDGGDVRLGVFTSKLDEFKSLYIEAAELTASNVNLRKGDLLVVNLSHSSPACATLAPLENHGSDAMRLIEKSLIDINNGVFELQERHFILFERLKDFCKTNFSKFQRLWLSRDGKCVTSITKETIERIDVLSQPDFNSFGSAKGLVQTYNSHNKDKYFHLYGIFGEKIKCIFNDSLREQARESVDKNVIVHGVLKYHTGDITPYEIDAQKIEVCDADNEVNSLEKLLGIVPHEVDLIEELRKVRNEW